ncbi:hypothetical protein Micbo1qcDRAFT_177882 [Microdochium bolleyi]|uniref:Uncharacterized protein n=1 Tax=Microdochium bolleyi TaxID=196109 RepID=A0A136IVE9_9PEZI|nr:hypothetical protein Micbo1qcDRAFT_177882 [Microdochium bolleyi]
MAAGAVSESSGQQQPPTASMLPRRSAFGSAARVGGEELQAALLAWNPLISAAAEQPGYAGAGQANLQNGSLSAVRCSGESVTQDSVSSTIPRTVVSPYVTRGLGSTILRIGDADNSPASSKGGADGGRHCPGEPRCVGRRQGATGRSDGSRSAEAWYAADPFEKKKVWTGAQRAWPGPSMR